MSKGRFGIYGGQYIAETLMNELINLEEKYEFYKKDKELFKRIIENTRVFSKFAVLNNKNLIMFYCNSFMQDNIYYIKDYDAIVIAEMSKEIIYILEVFGTKDIDLESIINKIGLFV